MTRLIDRIRRYGLNGCDRMYYDVARMLNGKIPVICVDNVSEYLFVGTDQEYWKATNDFPNLAPPFERCFYESAHPSGIVSAVKGNQGWTKIEHAWGFLAASVESEKLRDHIPDVKDPRIMEFNQEIVERSKWVTRFYLFFEHASVKHASVPGARAILGPVTSHTIGIDEHGVILTRKSGEELVCHEVLYSQFNRNPEVGNDWLNESISLWYPVLLAISFMHCKNVVRVKETVSGTKLSKLNEKRWKRPLTDFITLKIDPMKEILRKEGKSESTGLSNALRICKGHFKTFDEKPLFGKYTGTWWWGPRIKTTSEVRYEVGTKEKGK